MALSKLLSLIPVARQTGYRHHICLASWLTLRNHFMSKGIGLDLANRYLDRFFYMDAEDYA
jgi:hypothetical protein